MEREQHLEYLHIEGQAFVESVTADPAAVVPSCPGWTCGDLARHLGVIWLWVAEVIQSGAHERPDKPDPPGRDVALRAWLDDALGLLRAELAGADPETPYWGWAGSGVGFWARRMAQETAIHRWDADLATAAPAPIPAELAVDGVDEFLGLVQHRRRDALPDSGETIHLHATDADGEWLVTLDGANFTVERIHAKGDVAARGSSSQLDLFCWGRVPASELEVFGDASLLDRFQAAANW